MSAYSPSGSEPAPPGCARAAVGLPPAVLFASYGVLCLVPLIIAGVQGQPARNIFRGLSSGLVMVGYAMALLQFVLSGRFEWLSGRTGIDRIMRFHQVAPWAILAFVIAHPLLIAAPRLVPYPSDALLALKMMFSSQNLRSGVIALLSVILLVPLAVFRDRLPFRYELWRLSHGLFAIAIVVFGTHHTLRVGTHSTGWLAAFWLVAAILAPTAMLHTYVLKPLLQLRVPYRVVSNRKVADRMWEIAIEPEHGAAMEFAPGQFVWLNLGHSSFSRTEHPFSISSAPTERPHIAFTIRENGDFTGCIGGIVPGTRAYLDGPHGSFTMAGRDARGIVFIAGGVGFAPIISMLRQFKAGHYPHPLRLIYGNRVETQILYREEIEALKDALDFDPYYVLSDPPAGWRGLVGELTPEILNNCLESIGTDEWLFFVCGPPPMINTVERALIARGVPRTRIVSERFGYD
jgi:predicted ferric reductase